MPLFETSVTKQFNSNSLSELNIACEVRNLSVSFPDSPERKVLNGIDLTVQKGESVLLLGPSGSGKSTLGYVVGGLIPRSIEGNVTGDVSVHGRVGMLFQDPETQFCMLTAEDEVAFGLENLGVNRSEMPSRIEAVLRRFDLLDWKTRNTIKMSGGMKQKLAMACLLAMEPDLYIFDEPTANLDPVATKDILAEIHQLHQSEEKTLLLIEHKVQGLLDWVDRVVLLGRDGSLLDDGNPQTVFARRQAEIRSFGIWQPTLWKWFIQYQNFLEPEGSCPLREHHLSNITFPNTVDELIDSLDQRKETTQQQKEDPLQSLLQEVNSEVYGNKNLVSTKPIFTVENACFGYEKGKKVWGPIRFTIETGEWVAIVGPNGSGKSTLLSALMGLQKLSSGQILLNGRPLDSYSSKELFAQLGFVFQNPEHQFITDTVWQEVAFGTDAENNSTIKEQVRRILDDLGLGKVADANPFSLSQGEKRRLSVASTLLIPRQALLLDEPTFGQDALTSHELEEKLADLHEQGRTIIMVTHDMELVARRAQKVLVLAEGNLLFAGKPFDLFQADTGTGHAERPGAVLQKANLIRPVGFDVWEVIKRREDMDHAAFATSKSFR